MEEIEKKKRKSSGNEIIITEKDHQKKSKCKEINLK